jgi:murein L,D-transpeptidase YcbB/YkuD
MATTRRTRALIVVLCLATLGAASLGTATSAESPTTPAAPSRGLPSAIASHITELATEATPTVRGDSLAAYVIIDDFYSRRGFEPAWTDPKRAQALISAIRDSVEDGLEPADYHYSSLLRLSQEVAQPGVTDSQRAEFDLLMTDAAVRLGYHLWFGKVDPVSFDSGWNLARRVPGLDPAVEIERALATPDLAATLRAQRPTLRLYTELRRELARYREIAARGGWEVIPAGPTLRAGNSDPRVPLLRARLAATGDLPDATLATGQDPQLFDAALAQALRAFQSRNGVTADGAAGPGTLAELNVSVQERIRQLRINLDRGRVLLYDLPAEFVVVNIASQQVYYVKDQQIAWSARAQVGKQYRQTPEYRSAINYLVINPTWTVPPGIIRNDILPAARRDPASITRKGLRVLDSSGREVPPASVNWQKYNSGNIPYTLRQDPGPTNSLGLVKFMFPNPYAVYLHDTPSRSLFENDQRTTSSGCVRVERPFELAELLLNDPVKWNRAEIDRAVATGKLQNVTLQKRVPVLLVYWTAWVDAQGVVQFRRDVYGRDEKWARALEEPFRFRAQPLS